VSDKNARSILLSDDALRRSDIVLERCLRLLNDADVVAIFDENVVDAFPARTICSGAVNEDNIPDAMVFFLILRREVLGVERAAGDHQ
jgi:hypothetical protein